MTDQQPPHIDQQPLNPNLQQGNFPPPPQQDPYANQGQQQFQQQPYPPGQLPPQQGFQGGPPPQQQGYQGGPPQQQFVPKHVQSAMDNANMLAAITNDPALPYRQGSGILVKQKLELWEIMSGGFCETKNSYCIFGINEQGQKAGDFPLYKGKEESTCFQRFFCAGRDREFSLRLKLGGGSSGNPFDFSGCAFYLDRPYTCTCLCFNRPEMQVFLATPEDLQQGRKPSKLVGYLVNPFQCCSYGIDIYDHERKPLYNLRATCCQLGILCKGWPCEACQTVDFDVLDANTGRLCTDASLQKQTKGCCASMLSDADNFVLKWPKNSSEQARILLAMSALFVDYMYFEDKGKDQKEGAGGLVGGLLG